jgi:hypothetical protein
MVFCEQFRRQWRLHGKVDYVVCDSPLLLSSVYFQYYQDKQPSFFDDDYRALSIEFFDASFRQFDNWIFYLHRAKQYIKVGRNQTETEAIAIDHAIYNKLISRPYKFEITDSQTAIDDIYKYVVENHE